MVQRHQEVVHKFFKKTRVMKNRDPGFRLHHHNPYQPVGRVCCPSNSPHHQNGVNIVATFTHGVNNAAGRNQNQLHWRMKEGWRVISLLRQSMEDNLEICHLGKENGREEVWVRIKKECLISLALREKKKPSTIDGNIPF